MKSITHIKDIDLGQFGSLFNINIDSLKNICNISTYSHISKVDGNFLSSRKIDKNIRNSYDIEASKIINSLGDFNFLCDEIKLKKIIIYEVGSFFKPHTDFLNGDDIGTIILCLYDEYEGGEIKIEDKNIKLNKREWIFIDRFTRHEILPVTKGIRVVLTFTVEVKDTEYTMLKIHHDIMGEKD
jgi:hypothetical protein